jgi:energy-converting hydrogenase Eha subunit B
MNKFTALIIIALATLLQAMPSDTCNQNTWVTNGPVYAIAPAGDKVYIGGSFNRVGPYTGGVFDSIHSVARNNIAALDATTGKALPWNPNAGYNSNQSACILALAVSGTTVYAGGIFNTIGGQSRNNIAALDMTTGNATTWNPNANGRVQSIAVNGTTVYAGGTFDSIGGKKRNNIAALDATTGNATSWNPNADDNVNTLDVSGSTVYAVGGFTTIGGQSRNYIAALDVTTGNATAWNPNAEGPLYSFVVNGTTVYAGGVFYSIGGQSRGFIAALDTATGNALAWNPNALSSDVWNRGVYSLALNGTTIYAGGGLYHHWWTGPKRHRRIRCGNRECLGLESGCRGP